ncbi:unnamed protein product [Cuscuta epithymum]|uniref:RING-CH-type domain-containing protein n=1 Tax=Cuscuta epithymum TaxID=186058 RepID=A0AAV0EAY7_9ASTE|nr:unnamed protein product [Cuscuta epithymum]
MGDRFALPVGLMLTDSTLEAIIQSKNLSLPAAVENLSDDFSSHRIDINDQGVGSSPRTLLLVECRICHDEDEDLNMEIPCSCRGSLKYVHRRCVQRWCNEKGDTVCEICHQQFKPGYTAPPPPLFHHSRIPLNLRENWYTSGRDRHIPPYITLVSTEHNFTDPNIQEHCAYTPRSLICCRVVVITFMLLMILRHALPVIIYGGRDYSLTLFIFLVLRTTGILLPIYVMAKAAFASVRRRRRRHPSEDGDHNSSLAMLEEGDELLLLQPSQQS